MKLDTARFKPTDYEVADYSITVEMGTKLEDVLQPEFFANVAPRLTPYCKVRVRTDDGAWYAELLVLSVGRVWAKTTPLHCVDLTAGDVDLTDADRSDKYRVQYRGPHLKWCAVNKESGDVLRDSMESKREATAWLSDYAKTA